MSEDFVHAHYYLYRKQIELVWCNLGLPLKGDGLLEGHESSSSRAHLFLVSVFLRIK